MWGWWHTHTQWTHTVYQSLPVALYVLLWHFLRLVTCFWTRLQRSSHMALIVGNMMSILLSFHRFSDSKSMCLLYNIFCGYYSASCLWYMFSNVCFCISGRYDTNIKNLILFAECLFVCFVHLNMGEIRWPTVQHWIKHMNKSECTMNNKKNNIRENAIELQETTEALRGKQDFFLLIHY